MYLLNLNRMAADRRSPFLHSIGIIMRHIILTVLIGLALQTGVAQAEAAKPTVGQAYGDWKFQCSALKQDTTRCAFVQTIVASTDQRKIAQLQIVEADGAEPQFTILLPLGLDLQTAVTMKIDDADPITVPLKTCVQQGCLGTIAIDASLKESLAAGQSLKVQFSLANGKKDISFAGSLKGLADAFTAAAWF